jgi:hypothetical protein
VDVVHPLTRNSSRGDLIVLSSFSRRSPHEAPPHEGLLRWASIIDFPLGQSWAIEGAQEQVDRDTPVSRTLTPSYPTDLVNKPGLTKAMEASMNTVQLATKDYAKLLCDTFDPVSGCRIAVLFPF